MIDVERMNSSELRRTLEALAWELACCQFRRDNPNAEPDEVFEWAEVHQGEYRDRALEGLALLAVAGGAKSGRGIPFPRNRS